MKRDLLNASMKSIIGAIFFIALATSNPGQSQTAIPNPVCYGQPIHLYCTLPGCENPGATITWSNYSGSWTSSLRDPVINPGEAGYASDEFFLTVSYSPPPGGFSAGSVLVTLLSPFLPGTASSSQTICSGTVPLPLTATAPTGGEAPYTCRWQNSFDNLIFNDIPGAEALSYQPPALTATQWFRVKQTSSADCGAVYTNVVKITVEPKPAITAETGNLTCFNSDDGFIDLTVSGGTPPFQFLWNNGATTEDLYDLAAGVYKVTVTDGNDCEGLETWTINMPDELTISYTPTNVTSCHGNNGSISNLNVSGGTGPYTYLWSNNATTPGLYGLTAGTYYVTVTDDNGCTAILAITITEPCEPPIAPVNPHATNITITSAELGWIKVGCETTWNIKYGLPGFNPGSQGTLISGVNLNPYTLTGLARCTAYEFYVQSACDAITVSDWAGPCTFSTSAFSCGISTVSDFDGNTYNSVQIGSQCWMKQNLATTHYANGIAIPYITDNSAWGALGDNNTDDAYCWYNNDISNKNIYGALYTWAAAMGDNAVSSNTNPSGVQGVCPDGWHLPSDAEWTQLPTFLGGLSISGGKMKETGTTHWNPPNTGASNSSGFTGLPGGYRSSSSGSFNSLGNFGYSWSSRSVSAGTSAYAMRLNYNNEAVYRSNFSKSFGYSVRCLKNSCDIIELNLTPTPVRCFALADGSIELSVSCGNPGYTYLWSNNATTRNISDLIAGVYTVTVTDTIGCQAIASAIITEPAELTLLLIPASVTSCGATDGQIELYVSGGTGPYTLLWSNNATTPGLDSLTAGTYTVTATDENSCTAIASITITEPCEPPIPPTNLQATNITSTSAELGWIKGGCETFWNIKYGFPGFNPDIEGTEIPGVIDNPLTLTGLEGCTTYEFYVQSACDALTESDWAGPVVFSTDCCPTACEDFDDGIHGFVTYNEDNGTMTSPPLIVIESPGSGGYFGDLGMRVTDVSGSTWIYDTVNYGGNYLICDENCICWDMNVVNNLTSYYPGLYLFKGFDPSQPISTTNPDYWAIFISNSQTDLNLWVNTCAQFKPSLNGTDVPQSQYGTWSWISENSLPWNEFIADIQGVMFRVDITGWSLQSEKIRYDSICLQSCDQNIVEYVAVYGIDVHGDNYVCIDAIQGIDVWDIAVENGGSATFISGGYINVSPLTRVDSGGYLHAYITTNGNYCEQGAILPAVLKEDFIPATIKTDTHINTAFFTVYPNPTPGRFTLELTDVSETPAISVELFTMLGDRVIKLDLPALKQYTIDLSASQPGLYLIKVIQGNELGVEKIIKN